MSHISRWLICNKWHDYHILRWLICNQWHDSHILSTSHFLSLKMLKMCDTYATASHVLRYMSHVAYLQHRTPFDSITWHDSCIHESCINESCHISEAHIRGLMKGLWYVTFDCINKRPHLFSFASSNAWDGVCKRALQKRLYSAKETYIFKEPTNGSHPIVHIIVHEIECITERFLKSALEWVVR